MGVILYFALILIVYVSFQYFQILKTPRPWMYIYPFVCLIAGLWMGQSLEPTYDVIGAVVVLYEFAILLAAAVTWALKFFAGWQWGAAPDQRMSKTGAPQPEPEPKSIPNLAPVYQQTVKRVAENLPRAFAKKILFMIDNNQRVRMSEGYWIKDGRYRGSRDKFVAMLEWGESLGAYERNPKSKRENPEWQVRNKEAVKQIANGNVEM